MANTIELHRTTYNALIVEQWVREGNREETMRCFIYIYIFLKEKSDRKVFDWKRKGNLCTRLCP